MSEIKSTDKLQNMVARLQAMEEEARRVQAEGTQVGEAGQVLKSFEQKQTAWENESWREALRSAAKSIALIMPQANLNSWEEEIDAPRVATGLGRWIARKFSNISVKKMYPVGYTHWEEMANKTRISNGAYIGKIGVLLVDEDGELWVKMCGIAWKGEDAPVHGLSRPLETVRTITEAEARQEQIFKERVEERSRVGHATFNKALRVVVPVISNLPGNRAVKFDAGTTPIHGRVTYETLIRLMEGLFANHQEWLRNQATRIEAGLQASGSKDLKEMAPLPRLSGPKP